jgi:hypothetical protein
MKWLVLALLFLASPAYAQISREALEKVQAAIVEALDERIVSVKTADELSAALKSAQDGWTIEAEPGTVYTGAFVAPGLPAGARATLRVRGILPERRVSPADSWQFATLRGPGAAVPLTIGSGWTVDGFKFGSDENAYGLVRIGSAEGYASAADIPQHIELRRFIIDVPENQQERRGVMVHGGHVTIRQCYIAGIKEVDYGDTQAIAGWDFPGPLTVEDCYLEAAGEVVIFGGADPSIKDMSPTDIKILNNDITRPMAWRGKWQVKNLLELKHARKVLIAGNRFSNNWASAQGGWAFVFTPANQNGGCPWCMVEDVVFERNIATNIGNGFNILGFEAKVGFVSGGTKNITIRNNLLVIDGAGLGGDGRVLQILDARLANLTFDHNTSIGDGTFINMDTYGQGKFKGVVVTNNLAKHNTYGIFGTAVGSGMPAIEAMLEAPVFQNNVLAGATQAGYVYPATTLSPTVATFSSQFNPDWTLTAASIFRKAGTNGTDLGASLQATAPPLPPVDPCVATPLKVTVTAWPRGNGNGRKSGTWDDGGFTLVSVAFKTAPWRFEATDTRGCSATVYKP